MSCIGFNVDNKTSRKNRKITQSKVKRECKRERLNKFNVLQSVPP